MQMYQDRNLKDHNKCTINHLWLMVAHSLENFNVTIVKDDSELAPILHASGCLAHTSECLHYGCIIASCLHFVSLVTCFLTFQYIFLCNFIISINVVKLGDMTKDSFLCDCLTIANEIMCFVSLSNHSWQMLMFLVCVSHIDVR